MDRRRVVVTGIGIVTPLGCELETVWRRLLNGESGIARIQQFDATEFTTQIAGEVIDFDPDAFIPKKEQRHMDPFSQYGIAAAKMAVADSGLDFQKEDGDAIGVIVSSGIGGLHVMLKQSKILMEKGPSRFSPFMIPQMITNIVGGQIAIEFGLRGPNFCITSACASAIHGLGESLRMIQHGEADIIVSGGSEGSVNELGVGGFCAMRALSKRNDDPQGASRPFDADRDGFVCSEGGGILILEELEHAQKRGAKIYCELAGYGRTCDAHHITAPIHDGSGAARAMTLAIEDAHISPDQIDYINAHGTSTKLNDRGETLAIKTALGEDHAHKIMISSTKSMTGHLLGAAGAIESVACAMTLSRGEIPPTINQETPDPECDLDYTPNTGREATIKTCLNNTLGFGGHNASLCFKAYE
ncbi:MAG: beta-ketoacyl-ACP synthase II [Kiritimatiellae bacterium]|nr:beta-ketoacyl-ACP synthase II [Kiritimatiellia bacterium]